MTPGASSHLDQADPSHYSKSALNKTKESGKTEQKEDGSNERLKEIDKNIDRRYSHIGSSCGYNERLKESVTYTDRRNSHIGSSLEAMKPGTQSAPSRRQIKSEVFPDARQSAPNIHEDVFRQVKLQIDNFFMRFSVVFNSLK